MCIRDSNQIITLPCLKDYDLFLKKENYSFFPKKNETTQTTMTAPAIEGSNAKMCIRDRASDALAVGALRSLQEHQIAVPDRVSLISFNDTSIAKYVFPALSTVTVYTEEMGKQAIQMLSLIHI